MVGTFSYRIPMPIVYSLGEIASLNYWNNGGPADTEYGRWVELNATDHPNFGLLVWQMEDDHRSHRPSPKCQRRANSIVTSLNYCDKLQVMLRTVLDQIDYTKGACDLTTMVAAAMPADILDKANALLMELAKEQTANNEVSDE